MSYTGLSLLTFKKKEALHREIAAALEMSDAFEQGTNFALSGGVKAALRCIHNCRKDVRVSTRSPAFQKACYIFHDILSRACHIFFRPMGLDSFLGPCLSLGCPKWCDRSQYRRAEATGGGWVPPSGQSREGGCRRFSFFTDIRVGTFQRGGTDSRRTGNLPL